MVEVEVRLIDKRGPESKLVMGRSCDECWQCIYKDSGAYCNVVRQYIFDPREAMNCVHYEP